MTIEDLSEIYRVEKKSGSLMTVRADLYKAMAALLKAQRQEYDAHLRKDPESLLCEGSNSRRKKGLQLTRDIIEMRMGKICKMALRGAMGGTNTLDSLTDEEKTYYERILMFSKDHKAVVDRLSGNMRYTNRDITEEIPAPPAPVPVAPALEPEPEPVEEYYEPEDDIPVPAPAKPAEVVVDIPDIPFEELPEAGEFEIEEEPEQIIPDDELDKMMPGEPKEEEKPAVAEEEEYILIRMKQDLPTMAGPTRDYTLKNEQVVRMPAEFARALINRDFAVKISYSP